MCPASVTADTRLRAELAQPRGLALLVGPSKADFML
jgi:hypothetical protein